MEAGSAEGGRHGARFGGSRWARQRRWSARRTRFSKTFDITSFLAADDCAGASGDSAFTDRPQKMVFRADGDKYLLVEYGELELDLYLRFRVHILEQKLRELSLAGIIDITPGVRSLHIHYDSRKIARAKLIDAAG